MRCAVSNCGNNNRNGNRQKWRYFHFPKDETQNKWIDFCQRKTSLNTATACICNEHFTPDDFERNMQYDFGFTRKNPTKLKAGSYPTLNSPSILALQNPLKKTGRGKSKRDTETMVKEESVDELHTQDEPSVQIGGEVIEMELYDFSSNMETIYASYQSNDNQSIESHEQIQSNDHLVLEITESLTAQTTNEDRVEIVESIDGTYVRHLEMELSSLKCEVFHLKDERQQFLDEIENLRSCLRHTELQREEAIKQYKHMATKLKTTITPDVKKKTVMRLMERSKLN